MDVRNAATCGGRNECSSLALLRLRRSLYQYRSCVEGLSLRGGVMNNSQFWTWVDYWECWDFMQDELEDELELEDWADEALWLICLKCGNPLEGCIC